MPLKTIVLDLDGTLFKPTRFSKFFFKLANKIFLLGFRFEKLNVELKQAMATYDRKIILSGRANDWMQPTTLKQLQKHRIVANDILLCPRGELYFEWKKMQVRLFREQYPDLVWEDNENDAEDA